MNNRGTRPDSGDIPAQIHDLQLKLQDVVAEVSNIKEELHALEAQYQMEEQESLSETILIVDDSRLVRTLIAGVLSSGGYAVFQAESVPLALELLVERSFDLLIVDIHMPDLGGPELLRTLRVDRSQGDLPVLVCSGSRDRTDYEKIAQYGVQGVIQKPINKVDLLKKVEEILREHSGPRKGANWEVFDPDQALERVRRREPAQGNGRDLQVGSAAYARKGPQSHRHQAR
jgi:CheY-like chemotaxis protein